MSNDFTNVDLVRLSQAALPVAKKFDDGDGTLNKAEYARFIEDWNKKNPNKSPLLMQLHISTLTNEAQSIAKKYDIDNYKGVLTESELKNFMNACEKQGINNIFKKGSTVKDVLTGSDNKQHNAKAKWSDKEESFSNNLAVRFTLFDNWLKLDLISYKGSDKFFHAVGNYEAMQKGAEKVVKEVCAGQDSDKRNNCPRPENDYTEDLYANWLGRQFAKMYPGEDAHDLFAL